MKRIIRLTESDLARIVRRVISEENKDVCSKFVEVSKNQFNTDVKNMKLSSGSDTEIAKEIVSKSKKIYKFNGTTSEANKNLSCIGLKLYKSSNYDFYEPKLGSGKYFYIGVW